MVSLDNAEIVINQVFAHEPDAFVVILENEHPMAIIQNPIAIIQKDQWESEEFIHVRAKCRQYKAPTFFERGEIPFIGVVIRINLTEVIK